MHSKNLALIIAFVCCLFALGFFVSPTQAQSLQSTSSKHMKGAQLPLSPLPNSYIGQIPPARYDQQVGWTFTDNFVSLAYNVTAVDQTDAYGYGPAYLLNGLSNTGYWYQVGISYHWPFVGGYNLGYGFNYEVFAPNQSSVYPTNGGGGIASFSGPVNSGDTIILELSFYQDQVVMFAGDYNTGSFAVEFFSAEGANYFQGLTNAPANNNGFFTGLMTEWYHPYPFYGDMSKVTYSNFNFAQAYAWTWMDEFDIANPYWEGAWFATSLIPTDYTANPFQIHTLTFQGATSTSNAFTFTTGTIVPLSTSITMTPIDQTSALSSADGFVVYYTYNGQQFSTLAKNGTTSIKADNGTSVVITGVSANSTSNESWVLNALVANVTINPGSKSNFCYYDLIPQQVSYSVSGGGNPTNVYVTYYSAPDNASGKNSLTRIDLALSLSQYRTIMTAKGTTVTLPNALSGTPNEQWILSGNSAWTVSAANQIPPRAVYNHQFLLSFAGSQSNWQWIDSGTAAQVTMPSISGRTGGLGQRITSYSIDGNSPTLLPPTFGAVSISIFMNGPHTVSINLVNQYQVMMDSSIASNLVYASPTSIPNDNYWYDQGTTVNFVVNSVFSRAAGSGNRIASYTVNGIETLVSTPNPISIINLNGISSPQTVSGKTARQFQFESAPDALATITNPTLTGDIGWYDSGTNIIAAFNCNWNQTDQTRTSATGYTINQNKQIALTRFGNGTFPIQIVITEPINVNISSVTQYSVLIIGGFNVTSSISSPTRDSFFDSGTNVAFTSNTNGPSTNENTRQTITSYKLDENSNDISSRESTTFTTPTINMTSPHQLTYNTATQYFVTFNLYDSSGTHPVEPSALQIQTVQTKLEVTNLGIWLNAGSEFIINKILWENSDVKPNLQTHVTNSPTNITVLCEIYDTKIVVKDYLGIPIAGAKVSLVVSNGSKLETTTESNGEAHFQMIPQGNLQATANNFGVSASTNGNASPSTTINISLTASYPIFGLIILAIIVSVAAATFKQKRTQKPKPSSNFQ